MRRGGAATRIRRHLDAAAVSFPRVTESPGAHLFESQAEAASFLARRAVARGTPLGADEAAWTRALAAAELADPLDRPPPSPLAAPALVRRWVIRDDDLELFDTVVDAIVLLLPGVLAAGAAAGAAGASAAALVGAAGGLAKLWQRARRKGAMLDPRERLVLAALHVEGPMTLDDLHLRLRATDLSWTTTEVQQHLQRLAACPARDGTTLELVVHDGARWRTAGI
jgi:hypothetical protein